MIPEYMTAILESDAAGYRRRLEGWQYADFAVEPACWARLKYHFARRVWPVRDEMSPKRDEKGNRMSWRMVFYDMFNEPLPQYVGRIRKASHDR